jgi:uncharacterized BrkB/YihY/UPF0761 family membrane protein
MPKECVAALPSAAVLVVLAGHADAVILICSGVTNSPQVRQTLIGTLQFRTMEARNPNRSKMLVAAIAAIVCAIGSCGSFLWTINYSSSALFGVLSVVFATLFVLSCVVFMVSCVVLAYRAVSRWAKESK